MMPLNPLLALFVKKAELNSIGRQALALALLLQHGVAHVQPQLLAPDWAAGQGWLKSRQREDGKFEHVGRADDVLLLLQVRMLTHWWEFEPRCQEHTAFQAAEQRRMREEEGEEGDEAAAEARD